MRICVYGASSNDIDAKYISAGEEFGRAMAKAGHGMVFGGGANGMMGAAARGMSDCSGEIIGVVPRFFDADGMLYNKCTEMIYTDTMRERKQIMEDRADAFVMLPGGIGTFDEFFEILTLKQLGRHAKPVGILNVSGYYDDILNMLKKAVSEKFMTQSTIDFITIAEDANTLISILEKQIKDNNAPAIYKKLN
ncbi:MAG: TIGR00730 family Rossman fold protein [Oscillospiraceae bacterium]|nr:TIGR00730 family Rossman fold protein [Oscillospiraceae bacterium]